MNVMIIATRSCSHCHGLEHELRDLGVAHELLFVEDHPEMVTRYAIRHSPNLVVDGAVVFRCQPSEPELREFFRGYPGKKTE